MTIEELKIIKKWLKLNPLFKLSKIGVPGVFSKMSRGHQLSKEQSIKLDAGYKKVLTILQGIQDGK